MKKPQGPEEVQRYERIIARKPCPNCKRSGMRVGPFYARDQIRCPNPPGCGKRFRVKFDKE